MVAVNGRASEVPHNGVAVIRWPQDDAWREALAGERQPRLLLVERGHVPPSPRDVLEDWMWAPGEPVELEARTATLAARWLSTTVVRPSIDDDGVLRAGDRSVALSPQRVALARLLVERFDEVVHHDELMSAGFSGPVREGAVYLAIHRLRQRVAKVGLTIAPVRGRGFVLAWSEGPRPPTSQRVHEVKDAPERSRYELWLDGELIGIADYRVDGDRVVFPHTEIVRHLRGRGHGAELVQGALDDVRGTGRTVVPRCWYVAEFLDAHPEYADLRAGPS